MRATPKNTLVMTTGAVAASTALLTQVSGYGTVLSQAVVLVGWQVVASFASSQVADQNHVAVWVVAVLINALLYFVPASVVSVLTGEKRARLGVGLLLLWCLFYLALLFVLFPASDGP